MQWTEYNDVEVDPEKHSGDPVLRGTRVPVDAIINNFDSFVEEGLTVDDSALEVFDCFPTVELERIHALVAFRDLHADELQW